MKLFYVKYYLPRGLARFSKELNVFADSKAAAIKTFFAAVKEPNAIVENVLEAEIKEGVVIWKECADMQ